MNTLFRKIAFALAMLAIACTVQVAAQDAADPNNPFEFEKKAYKPDGTPWTGPVNVGDTVKYVLSYKPGASAPTPVTIDDTLSPNQSYVAPTTATDPLWTWGSSPYAIGNHEQYNHPGFAPGTGAWSVKLTVSGTAAPGSGTGDGTIPIPFASPINKVFGIHHHSNSANIGCWDINTLVPCGAVSSGGLATPMTPKAVVRGSKFFYAASHATQSGPGIASIGCFDAASNAACGETTLTEVVPNLVGVGGVVEDSAGRILLAANNKLYCFTESGGTLSPCASPWPSSGMITSVAVPTATLAPNYGAGNYVNIIAQNQRAYIHHGKSTVQCIDTATAPTCAGGSWTAAGIQIASGANAAALVPIATSGSGDGGVCLLAHNPSSVIGCVDAIGNNNTTSVALSGFSAETISAFQIPGTSKVLLPLHGVSGSSPPVTCVDFASGAAGTCSWTQPSTPINGMTYGFAMDPSKPTNCVLALGDQNLLWRFDYLTGVVGCDKKNGVTATVPDVPLCSTGKPAPKTFTWTTIKILTAGATGTLNVSQGTSPATSISVVGGNAYTVPASMTAGPAGLDFGYTPTGSTVGEIEIEVFYTPSWDQEICYQAKVEKCGPVTNTAEMKWYLPPKDWALSKSVDLGEASGPDCTKPPVDTAINCLNGKVDVACGKKPGTYVITLKPKGIGGVTPTYVTIESLTLGVTIVPQKPAYLVIGGEVKITLAGANPGDAIELEVNGMTQGAGSIAGTDLCCNGVVKVEIPKDIECWKPTLSVKKDCDPPIASAQGFSAQCRITVTGTNLLPGTPVSVSEGLLGAGTLTALGAANSTHPWSCDPVSSPTPQHCTIDGGALMSLGGSSVINATISFASTDEATKAKNCAAAEYANTSLNGGKPLIAEKSCDDFGGIKLEKKFNQTVCSAGGACNFEITVTNTSLLNAFNGPVAISEDMGGINLQISTVAPALCPTAPTQTSFACVASVNLPPGGSQTYNFTAYLPMGEIGVANSSLNNCVKSAEPPSSTTGEWWSNYFETVPSQKACAQVEACGFACHMSEDNAANLVVHKTLKSESCAPGQTCKYGITVTNNGTGAVFSPITLTETIPTGSTLVGVNSLPWSCAPASTPNELMCAYPPNSLAAGDSLSFDIELAIPANYSSNSIDNCVSFATASGSAAKLGAFAKIAKSRTVEEVAKYLVERGLSKSAAQELTPQFASNLGLPAAQSANAQSCVSTPVSSSGEDEDLPPPPPPTLSVTKTCDPGTQVPGGQRYQAICHITVTGTGNLPPVIKVDEALLTAGSGNATHPSFTSMTSNESWSYPPFPFHEGTPTGGLGPTAPITLPKADLVAAGGTSVIDVTVELWDFGWLQESQNCVSATGVDASGNPAVPALVAPQTCVQLVGNPPVQAKLSCDAKTAKLSGESCRCTIQGMTPISKTACGCAKGTKLENGKCMKPANCKSTALFNKDRGRCEPVCKEGAKYDVKSNKCIVPQSQCKQGAKFSPKSNRCEAVCRQGFTYNSKRNACIEIVERPKCQLPSVYNPISKKCTKIKILFGRPDKPRGGDQPGTGTPKPDNCKDPATGRPIPCP